MKFLILSALIWSFSFSLLGMITKSVDIYFISFMRALIATFIFLPFFLKRRFKGFSVENSYIDFLALKLMGIGALQVGVMSILLYASFGYLTPAEVALFSIFTPIYVSLFSDVLSKRFHFSYFIYSALAVFGAYIIRASALDSNFWIGLALVQGANFCMGASQVLYARIVKDMPSQSSNFVFFYIGALIVSVLGFITLGDATRLPTENLHWAILLYLGVIASGVAYFSWNLGASKVESGVLAIMNNSYVPSAVLVDYFIFKGSSFETWRLFSGSLVILGAIGLYYLQHYKLIGKI